MGDSSTLRESRANKLPGVAAPLIASNLISNDVHGMQINHFYIDRRVTVNQTHPRFTVVATAFFIGGLVIGVCGTLGLR